PIPWSVFRSARRMELSSSTIRTLPCDGIQLSPCAAGQSEKERGAGALFAHHPGSATMGFRGFLYDRQAESGSRRPMPRFLGPIESLKNPLPVAGLDRRTLIMHGDDHLSQVLFACDRNGRSWCRVPGRVIDDLFQRRRQDPAVAVDLQAGDAVGYFYAPAVKLFVTPIQDVL